MKRFWIGAIIVESLLLLFCIHEVWLLPDGKLHMHMLDIGQGDSILLVSPSGKQILIDGGPDDSTLAKLPAYMPFVDRTIELLVMTHPDLDHYASFPDLLRRYEVKQVLFTGIQKEDAHYKEFLSLLKEKHIPVLLPDPAKDLDMGDGLVFDIVWPHAGLFGTKPKSSNDTGIVMRAFFHDHSILLTADIEKKVEETILEEGRDMRADILKVAHHGSHTSSGTGFILSVRPTLALISAGRNNSYGHPHADILARYKALGIPVRVTKDEGTISVTLE